MRWLIVISVASCMLLAGPVFGDVEVDITYDKTKTITKTVDINIDKVVSITALVDSTPERAAEAEALINQENNNNEACGNCAEKRSQIVDSLTDNNGVIDVNQAAGNMNNQANAVAISVDDRNITPDNPDTSFKEGQSFADAQAAVEQDNNDNPVDATNLIEKSVLIEGSLNDNAGVVHANQSSGNMYNQANSLAMAVGFGDGGVALAEAALGQVNTNNQVFEAGEQGAESAIINKLATITESVNGNSGVVGVNQGTGNMGNQANVVAFAVVVAGGAENGTAATPMP